MFEDRSAKKRFLSAPPSIPSVIAAVLEPVISALCLLVCLYIWGQPIEGLSMGLITIVAVLAFPGLNRFGRNPVATAIDILIAWYGVLFVLWLLGFAVGKLDALNPHMLLAWAIATPLCLWVCTQAGTLWFRHQATKPEARRRAVIAGANTMGLRVAGMLGTRVVPSYDCLGYFDDREPARLPPEANILGRLESMPDFIDQHGIKDVFVTLPLTSQPRIMNLMASLQNTTASLHFVPDVFGVNIIQGRLQDIGGIPVVGLTVTPFTGVNGLIKRLSDIVLASLILVLIAPLLLLIAIGVRLSSPGPIIFRQHRTGLDGEIIKVYKFRSMRTQDNGAVIQQATKGDPRVTKFGAFLRRTSLDELPQFINVLQGRMSIVGPRPHAVAHNLHYAKVVKAYMARHKVRPGITGWAQVNGLRGETDTLDKMARRVEFDLEYLRNWSLGLDLLIIVRTIKLVIFDRDAY
ncbi:MAG: undecaprenyl-phosphate glucose phosphotransferase [Ideonella sp.]|nr:undecaprenyl-phosphate glucose phosphotransferase [Ideonella sp.]